MNFTDRRFDKQGDDKNGEKNQQLKGDAQLYQKSKQQLYQMHHK